MELANRLHTLALAAGVSLSSRQVEQLATYLAVLERWDRRINLTGLELGGFPEGTLGKLIGEPLLALPAFPPAADRWYDLGSGGGSPAIPLKVVRPETKLWLVESRTRKASFLREVSRELALSTTTVLCERLENVAAMCGAGAADVVTLRGVRLTERTQAAIIELLRPGGRLIAFAGRDLRVGTLSRLVPIDVPAPGVFVFEALDERTGRH